MAGLSWEIDGRDWPNRALSRFVDAGGLRWHVQRAGAGPALLLVHGTGASTHTWRDMLRPLAEHFDVLAIDLPGHGFTAMPGRGGLSIVGMASALAALLRTLEFSPVVAVGHSAGVAVLAAMALDGTITPARLVSLNGALLPMGGGASGVFMAIARGLVAVPVIPWAVAWRAADRSTVERLLRNTGSVPDARGLDLYARLFRAPPHVRATLGMMATWDLDPVFRALPRLGPRLELIACDLDRAVPPAAARRVHGMVPGSTMTLLLGVGHLSHEERPAEAVGLIVGEKEGSKDGLF